MITRVYKGRHTKGLLAYLYGLGRQEEHRDQHLVACWDGNTTALEPSGFDAGTMTDGEVRQHALGIARALDLPLAACDNHDPEHVYHLVMRNSAADRVLTDAEWAAIAADMMDRIGIAPAGDDLGCRWVLVRHGEEHVHLVATLARQDGRKPRLVWGDFAKLRVYAKEWEARLGLAGTAGADRTATGAPTIAETKKAERLAGAARSESRHAATGGQTAWRQTQAETPKVRLARAVHAAAARSHDLDSFREELSGAGVTVYLRESELRPGEITGVSFSVAGHETAAGDPVRYSGSKLAPDLGWRHLQARWAQSTQTPTGPTTTGSRDTDDEAEWQEAETIVREAAAQVQAADVGDEAADDAAWAAADAAFGFAWYLGGRQTSPAEAMARAGRLPGARRPVSSQTGRALRRMGRALAVRPGRGRSVGAGSWRLVAAMADLAGAVAARRAAQDRLVQAEAAGTAAAGYRRLHRSLTGTAPAATTSWARQTPLCGARRDWSPPSNEPGSRPGPTR